MKQGKFLVADDFKEHVNYFESNTHKLLGIVHEAEKNITSLGVLIVVGGPQYRIGSHRQFILLARKLAEQGISTMRFDSAGMGDAGGKKLGFEKLHDDINSAINHFMQQLPLIKGVVIWGLCDAASAASFYGYQDVRVKGLILLNPWLYTEVGEARVFLKTYYLQRILSRHFWTKIIHLDLNYKQTALSFITLFFRGLFNKEAKVSLPNKVYQALNSFQDPILFILSGQDLTAEQFRLCLKQDKHWQQLLKQPRVTHYELLAADHTFSTADFRVQVENWTMDWLKTLPDFVIKNSS